MTKVYITIDTEYSESIVRKEGNVCRHANFMRSISGKVDQEEAGIFYQMEIFARYGLKAVFFVDPMPALYWGMEAIEKVVHPILQRGHDVQLHVHTEWLALAGGNNPLGDRHGQNMRDFTLAEQISLIDMARSMLMKLGAPAPVAFRAGNYGANDDTLRALAHLGITYDSSHCPGIRDGFCDISLSDTDRLPVRHCGVTEVPVASIATRNGGQRHAQITALSAGEMLAAVRHARNIGQDSFSLVSHSFELMSRNRRTINKIIRKRFEHFCAGLASMKGVRATTYAESPPVIAPRPAPKADLLPHNMLRTGHRMSEQILGNLLYGAS